MVSPVITEAWHGGGFLVSEGSNYISRDTAIIANAGTADVLLNAGLVLAQSPGTATITAAGTNHATGTVSSPVLNSAYVQGNYTLTATSATNFTVTAPDGRSLPPATVGTAYVNAELNFTITAGTGTYSAGDAFTVAAPGPSGTMVAFGTATLPAAGVLFTRAVVPASGNRTVTVVTRAAEVNQQELQWDSTILNAGTAAAGFQSAAIKSLGSLGIVAR